MSFCFIGSQQMSWVVEFKHLVCPSPEGTVLNNFPPKVSQSEVEIALKC